jgi:hypothetical protein
MQPNGHGRAPSGRPLHWLCGVFALLAVLAAQAEPAAPRAYLWQAQRDGATVFLFGSIHLCRADCFPLPRSASVRLDRAAVVAVELDPERPGRTDELLRRTSLPDGDSLDRHLPPALVLELQSLTGEFGLPPALLMRMKPWLAGMTLTLAAARRGGYTVDEGIDVSVLRRAAAAGTPVVELETLDEHLGALDALTREEQAALVAQAVALARNGAVAAYVDRLVGAWRSGDAQALWRLSQEGIEDVALAQRMLDAMLASRNRRMAERLAALAAERGPVFAVVGALHMAGPGSLLDLLREAGYTVRQLSAAD